MPVAGRQIVDGSRTARGWLVEHSWIVRGALVDCLTEFFFRARSLLPHAPSLLCSAFRARVGIAYSLRCLQIGYSFRLCDVSIRHGGQRVLPPIAAWRGAVWGVRNGVIRCCCFRLGRRWLSADRRGNRWQLERYCG